MSNIVVYTQRVEIIESYDERRDSSDQRIPAFLAYCGYTPVPLPNNLRITIEIINQLNPVGIVLCGGNSLIKYGGNAPEKDVVDKEIIEIAIKKGIPIFGFCRGMQSILDYFGNELVSVQGHVAVEHKIVYNNNDVSYVNSYHNQACIKLKSKCLSILAKSDDGVIEMIKHKELKMVGIMWHPERRKEFADADKKIIVDLFGGEKL